MPRPPNPHAVLGVGPDAGPEEVRAARRRLVKALHPDTRSADDPAVRREAEHRLAEVNAAYDALAQAWAHAPVASAPPVVAFAVEGFRPAVFEALVVAVADVGDVTDADEPFSLDLFAEGPPPGFCRLELVPDAGGTVVMVSSESIDADAVAAMLVMALQRLGLRATRLET